MRPELKIKYGKFFDDLVHEIPDEDIIVDSLGEVSNEIEPGEPNTPTMESFSFSLNNFDADRNEKYDRAYWDSVSRTVEDGATDPLEVFFEITSGDRLVFRGVLQSISFSPRRDTVDLELGDLMSILHSDKRTMLGIFEFEDRYLFRVSPEGDDVGPDWQINDNPEAFDLNGDRTRHEMITIAIEYNYQSNKEPEFGISNDYARHLGYQDFYEDIGDWSDPYIIYSNAWIKIGDKTILTRIRNRFTTIYNGSTDTYTYEHHIQFFHSANDDFEFEIGRFYDDDGNDIPPQENNWNQINVTILDVDRGYSPDIILKESMLSQLTTFMRWMHGAPYNILAGEIHLNSESNAIIDVFDITIDALQNVLKSKIYDDPESQDDIIITKGDIDHKLVFLADIGMFGWAELNAAEMMVALARQTNSYLYADSQARIVIHNRRYRDEDPTLISDEDIELVQGLSYNNGQTTYSIKFPALVIAIDNIKSDTEAKLFINRDGIVNSESLRSNDLKLQNYRTGDLGVPNDSLDEEETERKKFRYGPDSSNYTGTGDMSDFLPLPTQQAQRYAESFTYPTEQQVIRISSLTFPDLDIGGQIIDEDDKEYLIIAVSESLSSYSKDITIQSVFEIREAKAEGSIEVLTGADEQESAPAEGSITVDENNVSTNWDYRIELGGHLSDIFNVESTDSLADIAAKMETALTAVSDIDDDYAFSGAATAKLDIAAKSDGEEYNSEIHLTDTGGTRLPGADIMLTIEHAEGGTDADTSYGKGVLVYFGSDPVETADIIGGESKESIAAKIEAAIDALADYEASAEDESVTITAVSTGVEYNKTLTFNANGTGATATTTGMEGGL